MLSLSALVSFIAWCSQLASWQRITLGHLYARKNSGLKLKIFRLGIRTTLSIRINFSKALLATSSALTIIHDVVLRTFAAEYHSTKSAMMLSGQEPELNLAMSALHCFLVILPLSHKAWVSYWPRSLGVICWVVISGIHLLRAVYCNHRNTCSENSFRDWALGVVRERSV